nr:hypothetical protein [Tanacetum cinerariifolium]
MLWEMKRLLRLGLMDRVGEIDLYLGGEARRRACSHGGPHALHPSRTRKSEPKFTFMSLSFKLQPHLAIGRLPFTGLWKNIKFVFKIIYVLKVSNIMQFSKVAGYAIQDTDVNNCRNKNQHFCTFVIGKILYPIVYIPFGMEKMKAMMIFFRIRVCGTQLPITWLGNHVYTTVAAMVGKLVKLAAMRDLCGFAIKIFRVLLTNSEAYANVSFADVCLADAFMI